jgi:hypothetical protein
VSDQANLNSFDHRHGSSDERLKGPQAITMESPAHTERNPSAFKAWPKSKAIKRLARIFCVDSSTIRDILNHKKSYDHE